MPRVKAFARERLDEQLARLWDHRLGLVIAPAGSGKTTLLSQFAASLPTPVAWYRPEAADVSEQALAAHLHRAYSSVFPDLGAPWKGVAAAAAALDAVDDRPVALIVDDLHVIEGSEAEAALERLLDYLPPAHVVLAASRRPPRFNLSRLRVSGSLLELGPDDLRFRSWEVEHLFRRFYAEPLPPEDLAELARRTEGWAAGLQLFHLATRGKAPGERRRVLAALGSRSRLVREYLARNVLDELPDELRSFLLGSCVLGRLSGRLCDDLLGIEGSEALLAELERRQIFTYSLDEEGTYRYHEVLRTHLESMLVERWGHARVREEYARAGALLEAAGEAPDALRAYCCAEDWEAAARLLGQEGEQLVDDAGSWLEGLPPAVVDSDPWLLLATARRYVAAGRLEPAVAAYERAQAAFGTMAAGAVSGRERQALRLWIDPRPTTAVAGDWITALRRATQREPLAAMRQLAAMPGVAARFAEAVAASLAGRFVEGRRMFADVAASPEAGHALSVGASLAGEWVAVLTGDDDPHALDRLADEAEQLAVSWLTRLSRALRAMAADDDGPGTEVEALRSACRRGGDVWGEALIALHHGLRLLRSGRDAVPPLVDAVRLFDGLGAPVPAAWAAAASALSMARADHPDAVESALAAEERARGAAVPGALAVASLALVTADPDAFAEHEDFAVTFTSGYRLGEFERRLPARPAPVVRRAAAAAVVVAAGRSASEVSMRCFGGFALSIGGVDIDCTTVKPRARAALHLLAVNRGRPVHRESLLAALWPDTDARSATRNLQVVVSSLRQLLEPGVARGASSLMVREGDAYRLALPDDADVDLWTFEAALAEGRATQSAEAYERALAVYAGDLLPEDGPADWVVEERDRYRLEAAGAAAALAELRLVAGDAAEAAAVCERGLRIDRYNDELWRMLVDAYGQADNHAAATRARKGYEDMLADLGLT